MRHWVLILLAVLFGLALGLGGTVIELGASPSGRIKDDLKITSSSGPVDMHRPHVAIEKTEYDFGSMERGITQTHAFPVKNDGGEPLTMEKTSVSCGMCIVGVHFSKMPIPPGESAEAEITWKASSMGPFRHHANLRTNDPSRPEIQFNIVGKVMNSFRVSPEELVLNGASATNSTMAELRIYSYRGEDVQVTSHKFLNDDTKDKFTVEVKPLTPEQLKEDGEAKGGVAVFVSTKPGLTVGRLAQQLELTLNLPKNPVVDVPIQAVVSSDVQVVGDGQGWDSEKSILNLEMVNRHEGKQVQLTLQARGAHAKDLHPVLKSASPDVLKVSFGQRKELAAGHFVQVPMTIEIPAGSRPAVHLGGKQGEMGEIIIETGHPEAKTMRIPVRFGIGD
jgi:hypothetical protein